ncbi:MAG: GNAT family N-acetyltransferase [Thermomicrobiales bacterium]
MVSSLTGLLIRPLASGDIPAIATWMITDPHWLHYGMTVSSIEHDLSSAIDQGDLALVADLASVPAGFAWCVQRGMFGSGAYLKRIGVDPAITGQGIGTALLHAIETELASAGADALYLLVGSGNPRAGAFYRQQGYEHLCTLPDFAIAGTDEHLLRKRLPSLSY